MENKVSKTGDKVWINDVQYTVVKMGDCSGDGYVNSADLLEIKKHLLEVIKLEQNSAYFTASDLTKDNNINSADLLEVKKYLLGVTNISINE